MDGISSEGAEGWGCVTLLGRWRKCLVEAGGWDLVGEAFFTG